MTRLETHILRPSPYFQGEYLTLNHKTVTIEKHTLVTRLGGSTSALQGSDAVVLIACFTLGFREQRAVRIVNEELYYNEQCQAFRVLCVETPLDELPSKWAKVMGLALPRCLKNPPPTPTTIRKSR
jgi:hypothetical protein